MNVETELTGDTVGFDYRLFAGGHMQRANLTCWPIQMSEIDGLAISGHAGIARMPIQIGDHRLRIIAQIIFPYIQ